MKHTQQKHLTVITASKEIWFFCARICIPDGVSTEIFAYMIWNLRGTHNFSPRDAAKCKTPSLCPGMILQCQSAQGGKEEAHFYPTFSPKPSASAVYNMRSTGAALCQMPTYLPSQL